jgi:hypothetical protein
MKLLQPRNVSPLKITLEELWKGKSGEVSRKVGSLQEEMDKSTANLSRGMGTGTY